MVGFVTGLVCMMESRAIPDFVASLLLWFTTLASCSLIVGLLNDASTGYVFEDIKPLSYFYIVIFLYYMIDTTDMVAKTYQLLLFSGKVLVMAYLLYILSTDILGIFDFSWAYEKFSSNSFIFRGIGSAFYYKGFIYVPIAATGFLMDRRYVWFALSAVATYFTYTRGIYVLFVMGVAFFYLKKKKINLARILVLIAVLYVLFLLAQYMELFQFGESFYEERDTGDSQRFLAIKQVFDNVTLFSSIFGHGFGCGVETRPVHMEMSYLEIFHKQGLAGISFWLLVLYHVYRFSPSENEKSRLSDFFLIAALLVYVQSFFNPYVNNPIGMGMVLVALMSRYRLSGNENTVRNSVVQDESV